MLYTVEYWIADYHGEHSVNASTDEEAVAKTKAWVWKQKPPTPCYENYKVKSAVNLFE